MTPLIAGDWWALAQVIGVPASVAALLIYALHRGWLVLGRTHDEICELKDKELEELRDDRTYWRDAWMRLAHITERATSAGEVLAADPVRRVRAPRRPVAPP